MSSVQISEKNYFKNKKKLKEELINGVMVCSKCIINKFPYVLHFFMKQIFHLINLRTKC